MTALITSFSAASQDGTTPDDKEKKLYEFIQEKVDRYEESLSLEYWQVFYMDSILTANYGALDKEIERLTRAKVENLDIYQNVRDLWDEKTYQAVRKILNEEQWQKYLKTGAAKEKKSRDKRAAKKNR